MQPENRPRVRFDPEQAARAYRFNCERLQRVREWFANHDSLHVNYEELVDNWEGTMAHVQRFLDVPVLNLPQATVRGECHSLEEVVENYEQVAEATRG